MERRVPGPGSDPESFGAPRPTVVETANLDPAGPRNLGEATQKGCQNIGTMQLEVTNEVETDNPRIFHRDPDITHTIGACNHRARRNDHLTRRVDRRFYGSGHFRYVEALDVLSTNTLRQARLDPRETRESGRHETTSGQRLPTSHRLVAEPLGRERHPDRVDSDRPNRGRSRNCLARPPSVVGMGPRQCRLRCPLSGTWDHTDCALSIPEFILLSDKSGAI